MNHKKIVMRVMKMRIDIMHPINDFEEYYDVSPKVIREQKKSKWTHRWYVVKKSDKSSYVVSMAKGQEFGCSCPVWKFQRKECHHIEGIKRGLFRYLMDERVEMKDNESNKEK